MVRFLKPTVSKLLIFLSPIILETIFWLVVTMASGLGIKNILVALEIVWTTLSFPGMMLCAFIPVCTEFQGDVVSTNIFLFYLASLIAYGIWYVTAAAIGEIVSPAYKKASGWLNFKFRVKPVVTFMAVILILIAGFYVISYSANRSFWYKTSGGKNIAVEKWKCVDGFLKVQLKNIGFEDIRFGEVPIYVDDVLVSCNWQGSLKVRSTATCISSEPLGPGPRGHFTDWHDIRVKTPTGSTTSSVQCR